MVDVDRKTNTISSSNMNISPRSNSKLETTSLPPPPARAAELSAASDAACSAYESYLRLPELRSIQERKEFPTWPAESVVKPALQALEITFRFISTALFDGRVYVNQREWKRRLESLATRQVEIISLLCEDLEVQDTSPPTTTTVSMSGDSMLPPLATWQKTQDIAEKIFHTIEKEMSRLPYTLGLGEPNLTQKPRLHYDVVCKPSQLHALKQNNNNNNTCQNYDEEDQTLYATHQLLETWVYVAKQLIEKLLMRISLRDYSKAGSHCWVLEKIWKLLTEIEDLHLFMDPDDFLRMKHQLSLKSTTQSDLFCFRSRGLVEITRVCKELRHRVPEILEAEADPRGGPRIQEAAMRLYTRKKVHGYDKIHLLQGLQGLEMAVKRFYYSYKQLVVVVFGSLEANGNNLVMDSSGDLLDQIFLEPTCYPSLDAAKTFLGYYWSHHDGELTRW